MFAAHEDATAVTGFGPAFLFEVTVAGADGVGVDGEAAGELSRAGKTVAGLEIAGEDGEDHLGDQLAIERNFAIGSKPQPQGRPL